MLKIILSAPAPISPFCESARDLRVQNTPLWLWQRNLLAEHVDREVVVTQGSSLPNTSEPALAYRDNLFFDRPYLEAFLRAARRRGRPMRAAFRADDSAFREHALPLSTSYSREGDLYLADLWYYPAGPATDPEPLVIDLQAQEIGYYHVPTYMADRSGDLVFQVPLRALIAIDSWVHVVMADIVFGLFARGARFEERLKRDPIFKLGILARAIYEAKQVLECSQLVQIGRNCVIDPTAVIHGPTTIGDNVTINAGAVIENCVIGSNVNISQGVQLMLSVVGDGTFLPFGAGLFMTTVMENSMIAQNTCLQLSVIGRSTFVGAGSTFTDYNLIPRPLRARAGDGVLSPSARPVMGCAVGHNCRLGSGLVVYPSRTIESDVVIVGPRVVDRDVGFEQSDHHRLPAGELHRVQYHPQTRGPHNNW
jgi:UDP-N-acetylglucosamine diphosphorylase / glucose-1-phosphate thymidylyltransferase / UDP-N-acetylgalactosamine diphosphorylase / glucosamine-1-phosphate N-acetyltransferase / galactosamine-1-phosphate N-acetyltransferase